MTARAFAIPLAAAVLGGGVTAGVLLGTGVVESGRTTTILQQSPLTSASPASQSHAMALTARDVAALNAGAAIYVSGLVDTLEEGVRAAEAALDDGRAAAALDALASLTNELAA